MNQQRPLARVLALPAFATALTAGVLIASSMTAAPADAAQPAQPAVRQASAH